MEKQWQTWTSDIWIDLLYKKPINVQTLDCYTAIFLFRSIETKSEANSVSSSKHISIDVYIYMINMQYMV